MQLSAPPSLDCRPTCGNGSVDTSEGCDGMDDTACSGTESYRVGGVLEPALHAGFVERTDEFFVRGWCLTAEQGISTITRTDPSTRYSVET